MSLMIKSIYIISDSMDRAKKLADEISDIINDTITNISITYDGMDDQNGSVPLRRYDRNNKIMFDAYRTIENYFQTAISKINNKDVLIVDYTSTSDLIVAQSEYAKSIGKMVVYIEPGAYRQSEK